MNKHKILVVDCKQQWEAVEEVFGVPGSPNKHPLNWDKLARTYAGIDVRIGETNKLSDGPIWVIGWDCIGPCIWDLAAVEAELEVRTAGEWMSAFAWIKAQEAKATSLQVLLGSGTKEGNEAEEHVAFTMSCVYMGRLRHTWRGSAVSRYEKDEGNDVVDGGVEAGIIRNRSGYVKMTGDALMEWVVANVNTYAPGHKRRLDAWSKSANAAYKAARKSTPQEGPDGDDK